MLNPSVTAEKEYEKDFHADVQMETDTDKQTCLLRDMSPLNLKISISLLTFDA